MTGQETRTQPSLDAALTALADRKRRRVLVSLFGSGPESPSPPLHLHELHRVETEPQSFEIDMCHVHLPKLADEGYIQWDRDTGEIARGPRFDELRPLLDCLVENADELSGDVF
ncbi:DUF7344 domain-containing protein [Haloarcula salinisoli]|uniref:DUF7344 domain-containing protein n=1 Tax=Haloarcula salinisoli TaxID=2487746 RepID=A0A8J7YBB2_9EURY|nr:hypothetical protein [Halomicroarcula salinisoli]MBX0286194.1 hypothetical protein [Halomicroarcula salinisoli]MBX0302317.1 hypothetical protein [Halomicroarcula salinisoli]